MYEELIAHLREWAKLDPSNSTYAEAADAIEELSKPRWIPVEEQLPEQDVPCLLYNRSQPMMVGWRIDDKRFRMPGSFLPDHPTHWMPLPEPPEESES